MSKEILMTKEESKKYETIIRLLKGEITQKTASTILHLPEEYLKKSQDEDLPIVIINTDIQ